MDLTQQSQGRASGSLVAEACSGLQVACLKQEEAGTLCCLTGLCFPYPKEMGPQKPQTGSQSGNQNLPHQLAP